MLFRRRMPQPLHERLRGLLWPRRGLSRTARYIAHRLGRMPGTPYRIAAGFAAGAAVSFTPFMGFHFLMAACLAWVTRANIFASAVGTVVGNPWTFPIFWAAAYELGRFVLGTRRGPVDLPEGHSINYIFEHPWEVFWPMAVGSLPLASVAWILAYLLVYRVVDGYQRARRHRRRAREGALKAPSGPVMENEL